MRFSAILPLLAVGALAQSSSDTFDDPDSSTTATATSTGTSSTGTSTSATRAMTTMGTSSITSAAALPVSTIYGLDGLGLHYNASVVNADQASTTLAVVCQHQNDDSALAQRFCLADTPITVTYGPSGVYASTSVASNGGTATVSYSCAISGTTKMACYESISLSVYGQSTKTSDSTTYSAPLPTNQVTMTAGTEKLSAASTIPHSGAQRATVMGASAERGAMAALVSLVAVSALFAFTL